MNLPSGLQRIICELAPDQMPFVRKSPALSGESQSGTNVIDPIATIRQQVENKYGLSKGLISIEPFEVKYSLYNSFLSCIYPNYASLPYFDQTTIIEELMRFIITQIELDHNLIQCIKSKGIKQDHLISMIKEHRGHCAPVLCLLAGIFRLNLVIWSENGANRLHHWEPTYDHYRPHIILYQDRWGNYYRIRTSKNLMDHTDPIVSAGQPYQMIILGQNEHK